MPTREYNKSLQNRQDLLYLYWVSILCIVGMRTINIIIMIILITGVILLLGLASVLQKHTLIQWWIPTGACALLALPCGYLLKGLIHKLTHFKKAVWNILAGVVFSFSVFIGLFYSLNYYKSDEATAHEYSARIVNKYTEEHYRVKRVSRNRVRRGEKYQVYCINIELEDGRLKNMEVPVNDYVKIRVGGHIKLRMEKGLFGFTVIKNMKFPVRQYNSRNHSRRY